MSEVNKNETRSEATSPHRGVAIVIAVAILLPLLYVLSIGPAFLIAQKFPKSAPALREFYRPVDWLAGHTVLRKPLEWYVLWWGSFFYDPKYID